MSKKFNIYEIKHNSITPQKGRVLIAEPFLSGFYFKRSIILLVEHNKEGSMGFVLNKKINYKLNDITKGFPRFNSNVFLGGPVGTNQLFYIHRLGALLPDSIQINDNLYFGGDFNTLCHLIKNEREVIHSKDIRFFIGYSGWSAGQLENEIKRDSWMISPLNFDIPMQQNEPNIWEKYMESLGKKYRLWTRYPVNPNLN